MTQPEKLGKSIMNAMTMKEVDLFTERAFENERRLAKEGWSEGMES
jgi:hypothetical protein